MRISCREAQIIKKHYRHYKLEEFKLAKGATVTEFIIISRGRRHLHDSGYPFIKVIGVGAQGFYDLGEHDVVELNVEMKIDCLDKNMFTLFSSYIKGFRVVDYFSPLSTLRIGNKLSGYPVNEVS